jgi:hypothetical protein
VASKEYSSHPLPQGPEDSQGYISCHTEDRGSCSLWPLREYSSHPLPQEPEDSQGYISCLTEDRGSRYLWPLKEFFLSVYSINSKNF